MTYQIEIPADKTKEVLAVLKALNVKVKTLKKSEVPNAETIAAMEELKAGKGKRFNSVDELFDSIK